MNAQEAAEALEWPLSLWRNPSHIPTGSFRLDLALGGGWPRGYISELYGQEGSGKSTLANSAGNKSLVTALVSPFSLHNNVMDELGQLSVYAHTDVRALHCMRTALIGGDLVVLDGVDSLQILHPDPVWARTMLEHVRRDASQGDAAALFVQGVYEYQADNDYALNRAVKGAAQVRVRLDASKHEDYTEVIASITRNKFRPTRDINIVRFRIRDGKIDTAREIVELAIDRKVIIRKRSWYYYGKEKLGQGLDSVIAKLEARADCLLLEIQEEVVGR